MKRRLVKLVVFLVLGAIVNVAVAWGLVATQGIGHYERLDADFGVWQQYAPALFDDHPGTGELAKCTGLSYLHFIAWPRDEGRSSCETGFLCFAGLPVRSVVGYHFQRTQVVNGPWMVYVSRFFRLRLQTLAHEPLWLPSLPLWPGFAINTVFYAMILWLLFAAPFALRRRRRIRRGLCPACAYPVGDNPVCTECGKPLIKQKAQTQKAEMT